MVWKCVVKVPITYLSELNFVECPVCGNACMLWMKYIKHTNTVIIGYTCTDYFYEERINLDDD